MLSVLTDTPGITAPMQANILPPTFHASCPPPQGSETSAPGNLRQMALTFFRLMAFYLSRPARHRINVMAMHLGYGRCRRTVVALPLALAMMNASCRTACV